MKYQFFTVHMQHGEAEAEALNQFLSSHRVIRVDKQWVPDGENSLWAFAVSYEEAAKPATKSRNKNKEPVDYQQVLSERDFACYVSLRELRKQLAEEEAVPAYAIFTNAQMAAMVTEGVQSKADMARLEGIGQAKLDKYSERFLNAILTFHSGISGLENRADSETHPG